MTTEVLQIAEDIREIQAREVGYGEEDKVRKLETIEDFRKVARALQDPDSIPQQYAAEDWHSDFGYCTFCREVTEFDNFSHKLYTDWLCKKCSRHFGDGRCSENSALYIRSVSEMPVTVTVVRKLLELLPRNKQKEAFVKLLREFVGRQKKVVAEHKKEYRAARKNVVRGNELLAKFR